MKRLASIVILLAACTHTTPDPNPGADAGSIDPVPSALARCADTGFATLWDVDNLHGAIGTMALSDDGILAVASLDGSLKQWNVGMSAEQAPLANGRPSYGTTFSDEGDRLGAIAFANDSGALIGGDVSGNLQTWSTTSASLINTTPASESPFVAVAVSPGETEVVIADDSFAGNVRIWNRETGALSDALPSYLWGVDTTRYAPDGSGFVVAGDWYGIYSVEFWTAGNTETFAHNWVPEDTSLGGAITAVAFTTDGTHVVAAATNHVLVFDAGDFSAGPVAQLAYPEAELNAVTIAGDVIVVSGNDGRIRLLRYDDTGLSELASHQVPLPVGVAVDASGKRILSAGGDGRVRALGCN